MKHLVKLGFIMLTLVGCFGILMITSALLRLSLLKAIVDTYLVSRSDLKLFMRAFIHYFKTSI